MLGQAGNTGDERGIAGGGVLQLVRYRDDVLIRFPNIQVHLIDYVRRVVVLEAFEFFLSD